MTSRPTVTFAGLAAAVLLSVAACGSSSATSTPGTAASPAAPPSAVASQSAASNAPSMELPSALESALASALPGAGDAPDASKLVTADMAASVIGGSPTPVDFPLNVPGMNIASYGNANGDSVTVLVQVIPAGVANTELQAAIAMAGAQGDLQPVSGIGDSAGKVVDDSSATIAFVKGSNLVVVEATSSSTSGSDLEPKVEAIAKQVASNL